MCKRRADAYARQWQHSHFSTYQLMTMAYESGYIAGMCRCEEQREERIKAPNNSDWAREAIALRTSAKRLRRHARHAREILRKPELEGQLDELDEMAARLDARADDYINPSNRTPDSASVAQDK